MVTSEHILHMVPLSALENVRGVEKVGEIMQKRNLLVHPTNFNYQRACPILDV